jgi:hypothetical protein
MRSGGLGLLGWVGRRTANAFEAKVDNTTIAITIKLFVFMPKIYGRVQSVATTRPWGFPMPLKHRSRLSLAGEDISRSSGSPDADFKTRLSASARGLRDKAASWFADHQPKRRNCRAHLSDHYRASYPHNGQSNAATAIAIRINPQIMDVRLSRRDAAASPSKSNPDFRTRRRLSG